jgi:hypothetical protein
MRAAGTFEVDELGYAQAEDPVVEEDERAEGLVLRGGGDVTLDGEVVEEGRHLRRAHVRGVAAAMEGDEGPDPLDVRFLRTR